MGEVHQTSKKQVLSYTRLFALTTQMLFQLRITTYCREDKKLENPRKHGGTCSRRDARDGQGFPTFQMNAVPFYH